jgi:hypothetical protein
MTIDDFEWLEYTGFDNWYLMHKTQRFAAAKIYNYNGWHVVVNGQAPSDDLIVDSFDAAKAIATVLVAQHIEEFPDATHYRPRASDPTLKEIQKRIRKLAGVRP